PDPRRGEGSLCRLRLRERRHARAARRLRRGCARAADGVTRTQTSRLVLALAGIAVLAIAFGTIHLTRPAGYERFRYPLRYGEIVRGHARNYDLDPALLAAVIYQESKFNSNARSDRGAIGLMQLLPETAKGIAMRTGGSKFRVADLYDPEINVRYGAW